MTDDSGHGDRGRSGAGLGLAGWVGVMLGLRFVLELGALGLLGWWGASRASGALALGLGLPVLAAVVWGRWVAPRARHRLPDPARFGVESVVWVAASLALADLRGWGLGLAFGALALALAVVARGHEPAPAPRPPR